MSDSASALVNLLATASAARVRFWPENGSLHYRSPEPLSPELRAAVLANKPALLGRLAEWDEEEARRLADEADGLVCELDVSGLDAEIQRAAALVVWAQEARVMAGVRMGCALVEERVRRLANVSQEKAA